MESETKVDLSAADKPPQAISEKPCDSEVDKQDGTNLPTPDEKLETDKADVERVMENVAVTAESSGEAETKTKEEDRNENETGIVSDTSTSSGEVIVNPSTGINADLDPTPNVSTEHVDAKEQDDDTAVKETEEEDVVHNVSEETPLTAPMDGDTDNESTNVTKL